MAHGSPILHICHKCKQYILVGRFSTPPKCPGCDRIPVQTSISGIRNTYKLGIFYEVVMDFNHWTVIK